VSSSKQQAAVICDAHPMWLVAVEQVLQRIDIQVVGKSTSTAAAFSAVAEHRPDLLITDLGGGDTDELPGLELIARARAVVPSLRAVALSIEADADVIDQALAAGVSAYVMKTAHPDDLASAVRQAFSHSVYLPGRTQPHPASRSEVPASESVGGLTRRESEILRLLADGHSNAQLAKMLWVTEQTVKFHLSNTYRKLGVANRTEASRWAHLHGLLDQRHTAELPPVLSKVS
jgi:DNA-binding NarL/FixJ family response regulator